MEFVRRIFLSKLGKLARPMLRNSVVQFFPRKSCEGHRPDSRNVRKRISTSTEQQEPAIAELMRERVHLRNDFHVSVRSQPKMGKSIIRVSIRTTLHQNDLRTEFPQSIRNQFVKSSQIGLVSSAWEKWDV